MTRFVQLRDDRKKEEENVNFLEEWKEMVDMYNLENIEKNKHTRWCFSVERSIPPREIEAPDRKYITEFGGFKTKEELKRNYGFFFFKTKEECIQKYIKVLESENKKIEKKKIEFLQKIKDRQAFIEEQKKEWGSQDVK